VSTTNKAREFLEFYLGLMNFLNKIWRTYSESTQDTTAVAFSTKPV